MLGMILLWFRTLLSIYYSSNWTCNFNIYTLGTCWLSERKLIPVLILYNLLILYEYITFFLCFYNFLIGILKLEIFLSFLSHYYYTFIWIRFILLLIQLVCNYMQLINILLYKLNKQMQIVKIFNYTKVCLYV